MRCPACGGAPKRITGTKDGWRILRCAQCTADYSEHALRNEELPAIYTEHYFHGDPAGYPDYEHDEDLHRERARAYLSDIARHSPAAGSLLDVGCATGFFLDEARRAGWRVRGCEVSAWAAGYARQQLKLDVSVGPFPTPDLAGKQFSVVSFLNVFEQLPDPRRAADVLASLVAPNGHLVLETWNVDALVVKLAGMRWHQYRPRDTPIYLNRRSIERLLPSPTWTLVEFRARTKRIRLQHGLHALGLHSGGNGNGRGARGLFSRLVVPYRLGDLVWVVLRRNPDA